MDEFNEEKFNLSINQYSLNYLSARRNEKYKETRDEIAYSKKILILFIGLSSFHIIDRVVQLIISLHCEDNKYTQSFSNELIYLIISLISALSELFVNLITSLRDFRGIPTQIMCNILIFIGSYGRYSSIDKSNIVLDFSYVIYVFASIFDGMFFARNFLYWTISYLLLLIFTIIHYFCRYTTSITGGCFISVFIILYYIVLICILYSYEFLFKLYFFYLLMKKKEVKEWISFFHDFPIGIFICYEKAIKYINKTFAQILGMKEGNRKTLIDLQSDSTISKEEIDRKIEDFICEDNKNIKISSIIENETAEKNQFFFTRKSGKEEQYFEISRNHISFEGKKNSVYTVKDQTSSWALNKELLEKEKNSKNYFISITHDMKNPLGSIIEGLKSVVDLSTNIEVTNAILNAISCAELLFCSVNDILDQSKIENAKLKIATSEINIREVVKEATNIMSINFKEKQIQLQEYFSNDLPEKIISDKVRIKGIILNLLSNALKFTRRGKVEVRAIPKLDKKRIKIIVEDTGKGIAKENFSKLFQYYGKLEGNEIENPYGSGIGLAFSRKVARLLGGDLKFNSKWM